MKYAHDEVRAVPDPEARLKEEAEARYWDNHPGELLEKFQQAAQAGTLGRGTLKARMEPCTAPQETLGGAGQAGLAPNARNCAAMAPEGYEAQKQALLSQLRQQHREALELASSYQDAVNHHRNRVDALSRAINLITLNPYNELLMELLGLKVL